MGAPHRNETINLLERAFTVRELTGQVDMVLSNPSPDHYRVASNAGSVEFSRISDHGRYEYEVDHSSGMNPLRADTTARFVGLDDELDALWPDRDDNAYPHAFDQIAQFFDAPHAPEMVAQHTSRHRFDNNLGQHGSLGIVQARAPFLAAGPGVSVRGAVPSSARMIDVAPSIMHLLGGAPHPDGLGPTGEARSDALLRRQDGDPLVDLFEFGAAKQVVVLLLDGCNMNVLYDAIANGDAPVLASVAARGMQLGNGLMASLPTATLANHTAAATGAHPGHSGVLHHTWWNRSDDTVPDLLSMTEMFDCMRHLDPGVETIHQAVHRCWPDATTAALFEFCDTGADVSSFARILANTSEPLPDATTLEPVDHEWRSISPAYGFMSGVDELATRQAVDVWDRSRNGQPPKFTWLSLSLTDEAGHEVGPHGEMTRAAIRESDARAGRLLDAIDRAGATDDTTVLVFADHGMELCESADITTWDDALAATGVATRDVSSGFIYLDHRALDHRALDNRVAAQD